MEPKLPLTVADERRMVLLLQKYLATSSQRPGARKTAWDLTKCDDETRKLFTRLGIKF